MTNFFTLVLLAFSCIFYTLSFAQQDKINFNHITTKDGLSNGRVCAILQDSRGFMWFGTMEGLNRYDGYKFKIFRNIPHDSTSISHNYILSLFEDEQGILWVGTIDGLNQFVREQETFIRYQHITSDTNSLSYNTISVIYEDRDGMLWIGIYNGGLNSFDKQSQKFTRYIHDPDNPQSLSNNNVYAIYQDRSGLLWIGTGSGLNSLDNKKGILKRYYHEPGNLNSLSSNTVYSIHEDRNGHYGLEQGADWLKWTMIVKNSPVMVKTMKASPRLKFQQLYLNYTVIKKINCGLLRANMDWENLT